MDKIGILIALEGASSFRNAIRAVNTSISSVSAQLAYASSEFANFSSASERNTTTYRLLGQSVVELQKKLNLQNAKLEQVIKTQGAASTTAEYYRKEVAKTELALAKAESAFLGYDKSIAASSQAVSTARAQYELLNLQYTSGTSTAEKAAANQQVLSDAIRAQKDAITQLEQKVELYKQRLGETDAETLKAEEDLARAKIELEKLNKEFANNAPLMLYGKRLEEVGKKVTKVGTIVSSAGRTLTNTITLPILALGYASVKSATDFESAFTGVTKTVDASATEFEILRRGIMEMSTETASSKEEIAQTMEVVGRLGVQVGKDGQTLLGFTRTMIELGDSTDISAEQAADALAKFMNVTRLSQDQISNLGSSVVALGNNFAANESDIIELMQRMAAAGTTAGFTAQEITGLSAAIIATGIQAEAGGTSMAQTFKDIDNVVGKWKNGSEDALNTFSELTGMTAETFATTWSERPMDALLAFLEGLNKVSGDSIELNSILDSLGMTGLRQSLLVKNLALSYEDVVKAVNMSNSEFDKNSALSIEASKRYSTFESRLSQLKETAKNTGVEFGKELMPILEDGVDIVKKGVEQFGRLTDAEKKNIIKTAALAAAIGPVLSTGGKLITVGGKIITGAGKVTQKISEAASKGSTVAGVLAKVTGSAASFGLATAGIVAAIGVAALAVESYKNSLSGMRSEMEKSMSKLDEQAGSYDNDAAQMSVYANTITELNDKESLSTAEKGRLLTAVKALNEAYPELSLEIDASTGKVIDNTGALQDNLEAIIKQEKAAAAYKKISMYVEELTDVEMELGSVSEELESKQAELSRQTEIYSNTAKDGVRNLPADYVALQNEVTVLTNKQTVLTEQQESLNGKIDEASSAYSKYNEETEALTGSTNALSEEEAELAEETAAATEEIIASWEEYKKSVIDSVKSATAGFAELSANQEQTFESAQKGLESQITTFTDYTNNLSTVQAYIGTLTGEAQTNAQSLLNYVMAMGIDGAGYMSMLAQATNGTGEQFGSLSELLSSAQGSWDQYATAMLNSGFSIQQAAEQANVSVAEMCAAIGWNYDAATNTVTTASGSIISANETIMSSTATNMDDSSTAVTDGVTGMATETEQQMTQIGNRVSLTMSQVYSRISTTMDLAKSAVSDAVTDMNNTVSVLGSTFYIQGMNSAQGLANGINDYAHVAINAAQNMAQNVVAASAGTIKQGSPAKVFIEQGRDADLGMALGISQNAFIPAQASAMMAQGVINAASGFLFKNNGARSMAISGNSLDVSGIYEAVYQGASNAEVKIYLNDRELTRGLKGIGVAFA